MVSVTLIFNGTPQKIVQWGKITALKRPIDMRISADYSIFENVAQKIDCYVGYVASGPALLKSNVVYVILFNFWKEKFGTVTLFIDRNGSSLLIFEEKWPNDATVPKSTPNSNPLWVHRLLNVDVWILWAQNATILLIDLIDLLPKQSKMYWKIGLIERGTVRSAVAVIWMVLCFILNWKDSIFLINPYLRKNIDKFFFYSRFKFQMLDGLPCIRPSFFCLSYCDP